jgi:hypothetical protein
VRSVIAGADVSGTYHNVGITAEQELKTYITGPATAFGAIQIGEPVPVIQTDFIYNINTDLFDTSNSYGGGTVTTSNSICSIATGTTAGWKGGDLRTKKRIRYRPGQGLEVLFSATFTSPLANSYQKAGVGEIGQDGFWFVYEETNFGILHTKNTSNTFIDQSNWNIDVMDGSSSVSNPSGITLDPTKGNVYKIQYQWLGYGAITFLIEHPETGGFTPVHRIEYANANTAPSILNPSLQISFATESSPAVTTDIVVKTSSIAAFVQGPVIPIGPTNSIDNTKTIAASTLTNILTIQNKSTYQSLTNVIPIILQTISIGTDLSKVGIIRVIKNATLGGTPSYTDISTNTSVVSYDVAGTTVTGGTTILTYNLGKTDGATAIIKELGLELDPGDTLTFAAYSTGTGDVAASVTWLEDM